MFCRGEEGIPLPPENEILEVPAGAALVFEFEGPGVLGIDKTTPEGLGPDRTPLNAGAERLHEEAETRPGSGDARFLRPKPPSG